ncbi:MAG: hypothetical protein BJ554DRAFT_7713, partial [Olpidium bornovanus]
GRTRVWREIYVKRNASPENVAKAIEHKAARDEKWPRWPSRRGGNKIKKWGHPGEGRRAVETKLTTAFSSSVVLAALRRSSPSSSAENQRVAGRTRMRGRFFLPTAEKPAGTHTPREKERKRREKGRRERAAEQKGKKNLLLSVYAKGINFSLRSKKEERKK